VAVNGGSNTYAIAYDDGDREENVAAEFVRAIEQVGDIGG
jgi:hypothetical protein